MCDKAFSFFSEPRTSCNCSVGCRAAHLSRMAHQPAADEVALAGHRGDAATARAGLAAADARVRVIALGALARLGQLQEGDLAAAVADPDPTVRRRAAEEAGRTDVAVDVLALLGDDDPLVV